MREAAHQVAVDGFTSASHGDRHGRVFLNRAGVTVGMVVEVEEVTCARCGTLLLQGQSCVQVTRAVVGVTTIVALATTTYCSDACVRAALSPQRHIRTLRRKVP